MGRGQEQETDRERKGQSKGEKKREKERKQEISTLETIETRDGEKARDQCER